ncbi:MAG: hypothetical protein AAGA92_11985 [Planctomycetota bacterium]
MPRNLPLLAWLLAWLPAAASAGPVSSFSDITNWTGTGDQQAAFIVDWQGESSGDNALAWGYRWDGMAYGEDMLRAVVAADERLFAKLSGPTPQGVRIYGLGYDADSDGQFGTTDGDFFNSDGVTISGVPDSSSAAAAASDPDDWYAEGWFTGFWHYGLAVENPYTDGQWFSSQLGASKIPLADGMWNSWAFSPNLLYTVYGENLLAAESDAAADRDADSDVDLADLLALQRDFDAAGLDAWNAAFGLGGMALSASVAVPEPSPLTLLFCFCFTRFCNRRKSS